MARYRKIDVRIWSDEKFQALWASRWNEPSRVPKSSPYPWHPMPPREMLCRTRRHRFKKLRGALRIAVVLRDGERCAECGSAGPLFLDHILPICWGGTNDVFNVRLLCGPCNGAKGGALPEPPTLALEVA